MPVSESKNVKDRKHQHMGKSSEIFLDKAQILSSLSITSGQVILDAGCGNGYMAKEFARPAGTAGMVYALDPDATLIDTLKSDTVGTKVEPFVGDITKKTKLRTSSIDIIYLSTVIHGFTKTQMEGFLREVKRLLKPGGRLAIVEIRKEETPFGPPLEMRFSPEELRQTIKLRSTLLVDIGQYFYLQIFQK
jgi:ubiquinone/menaquinone biosynthesis C-methylase UbiE